MYLERFKLDGRVAVVTGGAQAIGLACVEALAEAGAHVTIAARNPAAGKEAQAALAKRGVKVDFIEMDVTDSSAVDAAAAQVFKEKGHVDILVCNAGIARSDSAAEDLSDENWLNVLDVNRELADNLGTSIGDEVGVALGSVGCPTSNGVTGNLDVLDSCLLAISI